MKLLFFLLFSFSFSLHAGIKICATCGKGTRNMRYSAEKRHYCSEKCAKAQFSCTLCGKLPRGQYMVITGINGEDRRFCAPCSRQKKCFSCFFPSLPVKLLSDGRVQCMNCSRQALSAEEMKKLMQQLRYDLAEMYGHDPRHRIVLRQVSRNALRKIANSNDVMGCMKVYVTTKKRTSRFRKEEKKIWECTLYILDNLPPVAAAKVITHELTHDYLYHHAGAGKNPKITEGICEAVSGEWLLSRNHKGYFEAMKKNPDPVYGAGFREILPQLKRYGLKKVTERYRSMFKPF